MTDIVGRLRHHARVGDGWTRPDAAEAADEIERLRGSVIAARREGIEAAAQLVASMRTKAREASYAARDEADPDGDHDNRLIEDSADFLETAIRALLTEGGR